MRMESFSPSRFFQSSKARFLVFPESGVQMDNSNYMYMTTTVYDDYAFEHDNSLDEVKIELILDSVSETMSHNFDLVIYQMFHRNKLGPLVVWFAC